MIKIIKENTNLNELDQSGHLIEFIYDDNNEPTIANMIVIVSGSKQGYLKKCQDYLSKNTQYSNIRKIHEVRHIFSISQWLKDNPSYANVPIIKL